MFMSGMLGGMLYVGFGVLSLALSLEKLNDMVVTEYQLFLVLHHIVPRVCSLVEVFQLWRYSYIYDRKHHYVTK